MGGGHRPGQLQFKSVIDKPGGNGRTTSTEPMEEPDPPADAVEEPGLRARGWVMV
jgi:hypothetical protein